MNPIKLIGVNHVCLVVQDLEKSMFFFRDVIGMEVHPKIKTWLRINKNTFLHLVNIPEAGVDDSIYHEVQHFAVQVENLTDVQRRLFEYDLSPFQMDFNGNVKELESINDSLAFGIGTIFVRDPDGNLIEFIQIDTGIFAESER